MASDGEVFESITVLKEELGVTPGGSVHEATPVAEDESAETSPVKSVAVEDPPVPNDASVTGSPATAPPPAAASPGSGSERKPKYAKITRGRSGCLTCRERKKRCDEQFDDSGKCHTCRRLKLLCQRSSNPNAGKPHSGRKSTTLLPLIIHTAPSPAPCYIPSYPSTPLLYSPTSDLTSALTTDQSTPDNRNLLRYYIDHLSSVCSVLRDGRNGFRSVLIPMAVSNRVLLSAIYAFASAHLAQHTQLTLCLKPDAHYSRAVSTLSARMALGLFAGTDDATAMASLLLCSVEAINGDVGRWAMHCIGVQRIIESLGGPGVLRRNPDGLFVLRAFAYHDILGAVTAAAPPLFPGHYWADPVQPEDAVMGLTESLMAILAQLCQLVYDTNEGLTSPDYIATEAAAIDTALSAWRCPLLPEILCADPNPDPALLSDHAILTAIARAYRHAISIHLSRFLLLHCPSASDAHLRSTLETHASAIILELGAVPQGCQAEVGIVFPLFMAGAVSVQAPTRMFVADRLRATYERTRFGNYRRARKVLQEMWRRGTMVWEEVLRDWWWKVTLA